MRRKWKDLSEFVTLECDGQDMTLKLKEHRVHAIVFLNIGSYGGGTHPWGATSGTKEPSTEDGLIEIVGLTTYQLPLLQAGGHGTCIAQCSKAKLVTTRTIPMQVQHFVHLFLNVVSDFIDSLKLRNNNTSYQQKFQIKVVGSKRASQSVS